MTPERAREEWVEALARIDRSIGAPVLLADIERLVAAGHALYEALSGPPLWWHAVTECNEAHQTLDRLGAPTTRSVRRVRGPDGVQDVTVGLADRINALVRRRGGTT